MIKIVSYGHLKVSDLIEGFMEDTTTGQVSSMNGRLNIRPAYQREFVWDKGAEEGGKKQKALIDSLLPHGPPKFPCPWDSPGKNTGVGSHALH